MKTFATSIITFGLLLVLGACQKEEIMKNSASTSANLRTECEYKHFYFMATTPETEQEKYEFQVKKFITNPEDRSRFLEKFPVPSVLYEENPTATGVFYYAPENCILALTTDIEESSKGVQEGDCVKTELECVVIFEFDSSQKKKRNYNRGILTKFFEIFY